MDNMFYTLVAFYSITDSSHKRKHKSTRALQSATYFISSFASPFDMRTSSVMRHAHAVFAAAHQPTKKIKPRSFYHLTDKHKFILHIYQWPFYIQQ